jgi:hypothetical protein
MPRLLLDKLVSYFYTVFLHFILCHVSLHHSTSQFMWFSYWPPTYVPVCATISDGYSLQDASLQASTQESRRKQLSWTIIIITKIEHWLHHNVCCLLANASTSFLLWNRIHCKLCHQRSFLPSIKSNFMLFPLPYINFFLTLKMCFFLSHMYLC